MGLCAMDYTLTSETAFELSTYHQPVSPTGDGVGWTRKARMDWGCNHKSKNGTRVEDERGTWAANVVRLASGCSWAQTFSFLTLTTSCVSLILRTPRFYFASISTITYDERRLPCGLLPFL